MGLIREVDPDLLAALAGPFHPVTLVFVDWPGDPVRVHSGSGTLEWDGHDWTGLQGINAGQVTLPDEAASLAMVEGSAVVGGNPDRIDEILADAEAARGAAVQVWFGAVTERAGVTLVGAPFAAFTGTVGAVSDADTPTGEHDMARSITLQLVSGPSQRARAAAHAPARTVTRPSLVSGASAAISSACGGSACAKRKPCMT